MRRATTLLLSLCTALALALPAASARDETKTKFRIAWSIYVGWMPWGYASDQKIVEKWAKKNGIEIEVVQINDYVESINLYTAGEFDGCTMTNMDALTIPAAGGVDSTAMIVGDFSNGNDGIILKGKSDLKDIKGQNVHLVELSVSHYLLARGLESVGLAEKDIKVVNISDSDIVAAFSTGDVTAVTTWNPQLAAIKAMAGAHEVFDSSKIPGEIIDLLVVNTATLKDNPKLGAALMGAWNEVMTIMTDEGEKGMAAREKMATASGTDLKGFTGQLSTTKMFYDPKQALEFVRSKALPATMDKVRKFSFAHGLLGPTAKSPDAIGIAFPDGSTIGDKENVKLRFVDSFHAMAAEGKL
jgi:NitT/TauT family transport system substrate-binding protein